MSALPYMPLYVADYLADTSHLSALENGAYLLLIMNYWQRGKALPCGGDQLARIARVSREEWDQISGDLKVFFEEVEGAWVHNRIENELAKVRAKSEQASNAGKASVRRKASVRLTPVEQTFNHTDTDTDTKKEIDAQARALELDFEKLWEKYPKKVGKSSAQNAHRSVYQNQNPPTPEQLHAAVEAYAAKVLRDKTEHKFIKQLSFWLSEKRWLDEDLQVTAVNQIPLKPWVIEHSDDWILWKKAMGRDPPAIDRRVDGRLQRGWFFATLRPPIGSLSSVSHETIEAA